MVGDRYEFHTRWRVAGTVEEVTDVLREAHTLPTWWPSVYLDVVTVAEGDAHGVGAAVALFTTGWLPYTLRWTLTITAVEPEVGFSFSGTGDLEGTGHWTFTQDGPEVAITLDWHVRAGKPLLARLGWLLKPAFAANHHWAMARGQESLALELRRRRAATPEQRAAVPAPPPPTFRRRG
ncbi:polyketide cyclase [Modestobacter sp. I12A-02628]|uniref:Polyketide cyclase n=1 Tax=Goekera deserti TaxID=2497753 RepID=A0A7K3WHS2_9ACTN|nr:SRPBCC family protein [Goekera deserti]MPQ99048.1 polyketide cyclase [Goekera deserti]NDI47382.1 polyketide cyclase [Goekera deserti]NEL55912.1 polyketide cyclase [Goekera deserti]